MSDIPRDMRYTKSHEWVKRNEDNTLTVGITQYAQQQLGELVFVELPEVGAHIEVGDEMGVVESVKAASDIYCPITGDIVEINEQLINHPEFVNQEPYQKGWIAKIEADVITHWDALMDSDQYREWLAQSE